MGAVGAVLGAVGGLICGGWLWLFLGALLGGVGGMVGTILVLHVITLDIPGRIEDLYWWIRDRLARRQDSSE